MSDSNTLTIDTASMKKGKKMIFDKRTQCLYEINKYDLSKRKLWIFASIYIEWFEHTWIKNFLDGYKNDLNSPFSAKQYTSFLQTQLNLSNRDIILFTKRLIRYPLFERILIALLLPQKNIMKFVNFFQINRSGVIPKYDLWSINNLTIYFIMKEKWIDLLSKKKKNKKKRIDESRPFVIHQINVLKNDLKKNKLSFLLKWWEDKVEELKKITKKVTIYDE